jgi:hypothetical protein
MAAGLWNVLYSHVFIYLGTVAVMIYHFDKYVVLDCGHLVSMV